MDRRFYNTESGAARKPQRSALRTAAIAAGGAGLAYGGIKVGRAAEHIRRAASSGENAARAVTHAAQQTAAAAENARVVTGAVRKGGALVAWPFRKVGGLFRLRFNAHTNAVQFANTGVAAARYQKQLHDQDVERASGHFTKSAVAGAALGLALRRPGMSRKMAAAGGAGAGIVAQTATRIGTAGTKDAFGDRSPTGKLIDKAVPAGLGIAALVAGRRRLGSKAAALKRGAAEVARGLPGTFGGAMRSAMGFSARTTRALLHGGALAGGIAAADGLTSAAFPGDESRANAAKHGLAKGAVYGAGLAVAEPLLLRALKRAVRQKAPRAFGAFERHRVEFGGGQQLRGASNRFVDPLQVASGVERAYTTDQAGVQHPVDLPVGHAQVVRAALNRGQKLHRIGSRAGGLAKDAVGALAGREKVDSRGRPQKREWEKSWFKRAIGSAAIAGGLLGHAAVMRRNPLYRAKVQRGVQGAKRTANRVVPDLFPMSAKSETTMFDWTAEDWDVRDQRGRSARVFAPGARARERREKKWHERVGNIRRVAVLGALAAAAGGGVLGYRIGARRRAAATSSPPATGTIVPFPRAS